MKSKTILAKITRLCRENIRAFGETYDPHWPMGGKMNGAKSEGNGVTSMAREILTEIKIIRRKMKGE